MRLIVRLFWLCYRLPFLGSVMTKVWVHGVGHSPVCQILLQKVKSVVITASRPAWTNSAGILSTTADYLFFNDCTVALTSLRRMGWSSCVFLGTVQYWWISAGLVIVQLRAVFRPSVQYLSFFCEAFFWAVLDCSSFPCFTVVKSFMSWYAAFPPIIVSYFVS